MSNSNMLYKNDWTDSDVEKHWDDVASIYVEANEHVSDTHVQRFREAVKYLELEHHCKVLNVTSRDCEADDYIHRECPEAEVLNAEISKGLIDVASKLRPGAKQIKIDTYSKLPFGDKEFDRILSLETIEHVAEAIRFLEELYRVSKDNVIMVLSCPPATCEFSYQVYTKFFGGHGEGPHRFPSSKEVKGMLEKTRWRLLIHKGVLLVPVGPRFLKKMGERIIEKFQGTFISELGIRQFYVCKKS